MNAAGIHSSSCHSFNLGGLEGEGRAAYGFAIDLGDDEGESGECGDCYHASKGFTP
jgi:hypothetical protein